jgi:aspartate/methionine/tyrosine aminotransferase
LRASKIREVANAGIGRSDLAAFWFGEPDEVTPAFIRQAASDALAAGETFYTHNLGIPELREAIAAYISRLHRPTTIDNIAVTNSGMSALMIASQAIVGPGDHVVAVTPLWPNLVEIPKILGAQVTTVALQFTSSGWQLDVERLLDALRPGTRASTLIHRTIPPAGRSTAPRNARCSSIAAGTLSGSSPTTLMSACTLPTRWRVRRRRPRHRSWTSPKKTIGS